MSSELKKLGNRADTKFVRAKLSTLISAKDILLRKFKKLKIFLNENKEITIQAMIVRHEMFTMFDHSALANKFNFSIFSF